MSAAIHDVLTLTAGEQIPKYRLVYPSGDREAKLCQAHQRPIGVSQQLVATAQSVGCLLLASSFVIELEVDGAIAQNAEVYPGLAGKGSANPLGGPVGIALDAATADGDVINVLVDRTMGNLARGDVFELEDDFFHYVDADDWTLVASNSGTAAVGDGAGGLLTLSPSDGTVADNDESYLHSTAEIFKIAAGKPLYFQARITQTEAGTDDANWICGLSDTVAADFLQDDGAGPAASYDGLVFFKTDGETEIFAESSNGGTQSTTADGSGIAVTSGSQMKLEIVCVPTSSTAATVYYLVNGTLLDTHTLTFTGMEEMHVVFGAKNGGSNHDTLVLDYVLARQAR